VLDADQLRGAVRHELRGSKTPDKIVFRHKLPHTDTGKLLRRVVLQELTEADSGTSS
jgi:acyl-coenzyme A synthetase/AMP-(fatty) acid ligase